MSEDRSAGPTGQEPPRANQASVDFLDAFIPSSKERLFLAGSFPGRKALRVVGMYSDEKMLALPDNERHHVTAATYPAGSGDRDDSKALSVPFIVFDDIGKMVAAVDGATPISKGIEIDEGEFMFLLDPTWKMETSAGRYQYGFHFTPSLPPVVARKILAALKRHPVLGKGLHSMGGYFRLPTGTNTKPEGGAFRTRLAELGPSYSVEAFCEAFGLDLDRETVEEEKPAGEAAVGAETLSADSVQALLDLIPNEDLDYDSWIRVGFAIWGATRGEGDALWSRWSATSAKDVPKETDRAWASFKTDTKASATTLRRIIEERWGPHSVERLKAEEVFAKEAFGEVNEADLPGAADEEADARAKKAEIDELLRQLAEARPIPDLYDPKNAVAVPRRFDAKSPRDVARPVLPVVLGGLRRGRAAMLTAMPSAGKSTYTILAATAITHEDPNLAGEQAMVFPGDVVILSNEDEEELIHAKLEATEKHFGLTDTLKHGVTAFHKGWKLMARSKSGRVVPVGHDFLRALIRIRREHDIALIVIDTMSSVMSGLNENDNQEMQAFSDHIEAIARAAWAAVLVVHHLNKGALGKDGMALIYGARGASSVPATFRTMLALSTPSDAERSLYAWTKEEARAWVKLERSKNSRGDPKGSAPRWFHFVSVPLAALNPDGTPTTEDFGILEERTPQPGVTTIAGLQVYLGKLVDAIRGGAAVYALKTRSQGKVTVFELLGLTPAAAGDVLSTLSAHHAIVINHRDKEVKIENEKALEVENGAF